MKDNLNDKTLESAETIALRVLEHFASDEARLSHFMVTTGVSIEQLRACAGNTELLAGALRVLLQDESALLTFCANAAIEPDAVQRALLTLEEASAG